jgi:PAS domain-containing protein
MLRCPIIPLTAHPGAGPERITLARRGAESAVRTLDGMNTNSSIQDVITRPRISCVPLGDYFIATAADITRIKKAEEVQRELNEILERRAAARTAEVEAERRRLCDVLETLPAMICLLTADHHISFANQAFHDAFGTNESDRSALPALGAATESGPVIA